MGHGGARPGAGRPKGVPNARNEAVFSRLKKIAYEKFGVDEYCPLAELYETAKKHQQATQEVGMLNEANVVIAAYVYPKLKAIEVTGAEGGPVEHRLTTKTDEELAAEMAQLKERLGES